MVEFVSRDLVRVLCCSVTSNYITYQKIIMAIVYTIHFMSNHYKEAIYITLCFSPFILLLLFIFDFDTGSG